MTEPSAHEEHEADFTKGLPSEEELAAFVGNDGFFFFKRPIKWFDQCGNSKDLLSDGKD
jgi:hypothetical protein